MNVWRTGKNVSCPQPVVGHIEEKMCVCVGGGIRETFHSIPALRISNGIALDVPQFTNLKSSYFARLGYNEQLYM